MMIGCNSLSKFGPLLGRILLAAIFIHAGYGKLTGPHSVEVTSAEGTKQTVTAKSIICATGSVPTALPFLSFNEKNVVSSTGALSLEKVPKHLIVIGGGVIGSKGN